MHHVRQENLPFVGSSHEFVGAVHGHTNVSVFLFHGKPGSGPGPHRHPYDEIQFIREGRGVSTAECLFPRFLGGGFQNRPYWLTEKPH